MHPKAAYRRRGDVRQRGGRLRQHLPRRHRRREFRGRLRRDLRRPGLHRFRRLFHGFRRLNRRILQLSRTILYRQVQQGFVGGLDLTCHQRFVVGPVHARPDASQHVQNGLHHVPQVARRSLRLPRDPFRPDAHQRRFQAQVHGQFVQTLRREVRRDGVSSERPGVSIVAARAKLAQWQVVVSVGHGVHAFLWSSYSLPADRSGKSIPEPIAVAASVVKTVPITQHHPVSDRVQCFLYIWTLFVP